MNGEWRILADNPGWWINGVSKKIPLSNRNKSQKDLNKDKLIHLILKIDLELKNIHIYLLIFSFNIVILSRSNLVKISPICLLDICTPQTFVTNETNKKINSLIKIKKDKKKQKQKYSYKWIKKRWFFIKNWKYFFGGWSPVDLLRDFGGES